MLERLLSWKVLALALAENDLGRLQEWEVRAMAAFLWERLPRLVRAVVSEIRLEEAAEERWRSMVAWYASEQPRANYWLFGSGR